MERLWDFLADPLVFWVVVAGLGLATVSLGVWFYRQWRQARSEAARGEKPPVTWQEWLASMHGRVDQLEHLLRQFSQRLDKRVDELKESVIELESSVGSLEKPFTAVATRFSDLGRDAQRNGRR